MNTVPKYVEKNNLEDRYAGVTVTWIFSRKVVQFPSGWYWLGILITGF
jgi:hypothetical protein